MERPGSPRGMRMPPVGLGTMMVRGEVCAETVEAAVRLGYRLLDTASMYCNEAEVGQGIRSAGERRRRSPQPRTLPLRRS